MSTLDIVNKVLQYSKACYQSSNIAFNEISLSEFKELVKEETTTATKSSFDIVMNVPHGGIVTALLMSGIGGVSMGWYNQQTKSNLAQSRREKMQNLLNEQYEKKGILQRLTTHTKQLAIDIEMEQKKIFKLQNTNNSDDIKFIVTLGHTQHGKSTLCNRLCGDKSIKGDQGPFKAKFSAKSLTQTIQHKECKINNILSVIVDTPGYFDSENKDDEHTNNLVEYLHGSGGVDMFILVKNGTTTCVDKNLQCMLQDYEKWFGDEFWNHLIIIFTRIEGDIAEEYFERKEMFINEINQRFNRIKKNIPTLAIGRGDDIDEFNRNMMRYIMKSEQLICGYIRENMQNIRNIESIKDIIELIVWYNDMGYSNKLESKDMISPLIQLQSERDQIMNKQKEFNEQLTNIEEELKKINHNLDNPESFPIFFTPNV